MSDLELLTREVRSMREVLSALLKQEGVRLTQEQVCERLGVTRSTLLRYRRERLFPAPVKGKWLLADVESWEAR